MVERDVDGRVELGDQLEISVLLKFFVESNASTSTSSECSQHQLIHSTTSSFS